ERGEGGVAPAGGFWRAALRSRRFRASREDARGRRRADGHRTLRGPMDSEEDSRARRCRGPGSFASLLYRARCIRRRHTFRILDVKHDFARELWRVRRRLAERARGWLESDSKRRDSTAGEAGTRTDPRRGSYRP